MQYHNTRRILVALLLTILAVTSFTLDTRLALAQVDPPLYGPDNPPPLGVVETFANGSPSDGDVGREWGETMTFEYIILDSMTDVWWSPIADEVKLSLDGNTFTDEEIMDFSPILSNLALGVVGWEGSTMLCGAVGTTVYTRCIITVTEEDGVTPIPLDGPASLELPGSIGGLIPVPGTDGFQVVLKMQASWNYEGPYEPHLDFYDYWSNEYNTPPSCNDQAYSSFYWGYYWLGVAPSMTVIQPLVIDEGATGTISSAHLAAEDLESPDTEIIFTVAPESSVPPQFGTLYLMDVPLGASDTFTQDDILANRVTYQHNGAEDPQDGFPFNCMDGDGQVASDGPWTVFQFNIQINPINDPPIALPGTFVTSLGGTFTANFEAEDPDSPLFFILTQNGSLGQAQLLDTATGLFQYTADPESAGVDTLRFQVDDDEYLSNEATVLIVIENAAPVALEGSGTTSENIFLAAVLSAHDPDSPDLRFSIADNGAKGTAVISDPLTGAFVYTPDPAAIGTDSFTFIVNDGNNNSEPGTFVVTIRPNLDNGDVIVSDDTFHGLILTDPATDQQATITSGGFLAMPRGIDLLDSGEILVMDPTTGVIKVDPMTGAQTVNCGPENFSTEPAGPFGIAVENQDSYLVADGPQGVLRIDLNTGVPTTLSVGNLMFLPLGVCVGPDGEVYVADPGAYIGATSQIVHLDPVTGDQTLISVGMNLQLPLFIDMDAAGRLVVSDPGSLVGGVDQIVRIDVTTGAQEILASGNLLSSIMGIGLGSSGDIFVASAGNEAIVQVDPDTGLQVELTSGGNLISPVGLLVVSSDLSAAEPVIRLPQVCKLLPASPNPFNPRTDLRFDLPEPASVTLKIYDAVGRLVRTLAQSEARVAGRHVLTWDGKDNSGQTAASGVYFFRLQADGFTDSGKMVLMK